MNLTLPQLILMKHYYYKEMKESSEMPKQLKGADAQSAFNKFMAKIRK